MRMIDEAFWRNRRILLTGHTGFSGAWLALLLERLGSNVTGLALSPETPSLFQQADIIHRISAHHVINLENEAAVRQLVTAVDPEIVIHLAAQSLVSKAWRVPRDTIATNVMGAVHLFEALRGCSSTRSILTTTTDKVYLNLEEGRPFREDDPLGGREPYSASKAAAEFVVSAYRNFFQNRAALIVARAGNIIGGGDWSVDRLIPDAIRAVITGAPLAVRNPNSVRPWQYILDALQGYLLLIESVTRTGPDRLALNENGAWNFGPPIGEAPVSVERICQWIEERWPQRFIWRHTPDAQKILESRLLSIDSSKAQRDFGWSPRLNTREAVNTTLDWYAEFIDGKNPYDICSRQIDEYFCIADATI